MRWIGGSPCSGKSTVAARLATAAGALLYSCDDAFDRHADAGPAMRRVVAMSVADRLAQPIEVQVEDVLRLYREEFAPIREDLAAGGFGLAEGAALLPELLHGVGVPADRAVWIVPTEEFQRAHYARRPWARDLVAATPDPPDAFDRWMRRDAAFARRVAGQARDLGYRVITVDGTQSVRQVAAAAFPVD
ncbi:hypothetical protein Dvina_26360 [Dactylosporangium vinaceum]|uniref:Uncharacterized protein n=1 Tax=Dactylosporangium vinaceum TaxID=53362 RepID=A0ABV5M5X4_9ACTN|nr:hypothetical protein [Dactylosporangium vinaceum]UAC01252.1 hypothetical protein Dvina_26360 [Dactylosporangium vinaceum]